MYGVFFINFYYNQQMNNQ